MLSQLTIPKEKSSEPALNQETLYAIGLGHVQRLASRIWTDYNVHDPGITTLELLCYAITDLGYRARFPVKDLLASETNNADEMKKQFFTARQILPNRPLTLLDYRKLLIDLKGVKNAWLQPAALSYYADTIEGKLFGPAILYDDQITDLPSFAGKLKLPADAVSKFLSGQLSLTTQQALGGYAGSGEDAQLRTALVRDMNAVIQGNSIYDPQRFAEVTLSAAAQALVEQQSPDVVRLNRLLLEDAYPAEIAKNPELRDKASLPGVVEVKIRGLYNVIVEYMDEITADDEKAKVMNSAEQCLQANRNLCEDFVGFTEVATQNFLLCAELELSPDADVAEIEAEIFFQVQQYLAPPVTNYTLSEMLERKHKDGTLFTVDEIFNGPALNCGFIDDDDLTNADLRTEIRLSDVISIIMDIEGIRAVKDIVVNPEGTSTPLVTKWIVPIAAGKKALLNVDQSRLVVYKRDMPVTAALAQVKSHLSDLEDAERAKEETAAVYDIDIPLGIFRQPSAYYSFQNHFPALYGLSESGLSSTADDARKALAYQLKAYLLFFDQIMADYFAQLSHLKELFSTDSTIERTYYSQVVTSFANYLDIYRSAFVADDFINLSSLTTKLRQHADPLSLFIWNGLSAALHELLTNYTGAAGQDEPLKESLASELTTLINALPIYDSSRFVGIKLSEEAQKAQKVLDQNPEQGNALAWLNRLLLNDAWPRDITRHDAESNEAFGDRRNRFLDHLIARFAEQFTDFANIMRSAFGTSSTDMIGFKCDFLKDYASISSERSLAYNCSLKDDADLWNSDNVSGLERRLAKLLGIRNFVRRNLGEISYDDNAEVDATPDNQFEWRIHDKNMPDRILLSSSPKYATRELAQQAMQTAISCARVPSSYQRDPVSVDEKYSFHIIDANKEVIAQRSEPFDSSEEREQAITELMEYLQVNYPDDGMYLIETILLRPEQNTDPFLPICPDPNCIDCADEDPYSYRIHVILPAYAARFSDMDFRRFVEEAIRQETPAHILPRICWIAKEDSALLSATDLLDFDGFLTKLSSNPTDPVSAYLWNQVAPTIQTQLLDSSISLDSRKASLVSALNTILRAGTIYDAARFSGVTLSAETLALQAQNPTGGELVWLNRMLLDDAYPQEIAKGSKEDMVVLEKAYHDWIYLKAGAETADRTEKLKAFRDILFAVRNIYPTQQLHECDAGQDQPKFLLGKTALGTMSDKPK